MMRRKRITLMLAGAVLLAGPCMAQGRRRAPLAGGCSNSSKNVAWMNEWVDDGAEFDSDKGMRRRALMKDGQLDLQEDTPSNSSGPDFEQRNVFVAMKDVGEIDAPTQSFGGHWNLTLRARQVAADGPFRITLQKMRGTTMVTGPEEVARTSYYIIHFPGKESAQTAHAYLRCEAR